MTILFWFSHYIFGFFSYIPLSLIIWPGFRCLYAFFVFGTLRKAWLDQTDSYYASCLHFTLGYFVLVCNILTSSCSLFPKGPSWLVTEVFFFSVPSQNSLILLWATWHRTVEKKVHFHFCCLERVSRQKGERVWGNQGVCLLRFQLLFMLLT